MRKSKFSETQIIAMLKDAESDDLDLRFSKRHTGPASYFGGLMPV